MLFNSFSYLIFFPITALLYYVLPGKFRWCFFLAASYYFYMSWKPEYAWLLLGTTLNSYVLALLIDCSSAKNIRRLVLCLGLCINIGILIAFKYFDFFYETLQRLLPLNASAELDHRFSLLLPAGISFFTFRVVSYLIDVYRGDIKAERHFGIFALYASFFPSLLAGPIDRAPVLLPQFRRKVQFSFTGLWIGLQMIVLGMFKKVVLADNLSMYVDSVFNNPLAPHSRLDFLISAYLYTFQIYFDFSGYSDIAIGSAYIFGFKLLPNFNLPYLAVTLGDFWKRWHISLSTWFRDYLYIPLGGNRKGRYRTLFNMVGTMLICGLWHGASWSFVFWGFLHGLFLCLSRLTLRVRNQFWSGVHMPVSLVTALRVFITFHLVCFLWVFFRAATIADAFTVIYGICLPYGDGVQRVQSSMALKELFFFAVCIAFVLLFEKIKTCGLSFMQRPVAATALYSLMFWATITWGSFSSQPFIYFQF